MRLARVIHVVTAVVAVAVWHPGYADVYSWKDLETGRTKISNLAPPWYSRGEDVRGPQVTVTRGPNVVDDTRLPLEKRRQLMRTTEPRQQNSGSSRNDPVAPSAAPANPPSDD